MGMIERAIRNKGNQKLAAARFLDTGMTCDEVVAAVQSACAEMNQVLAADLIKLQTQGSRLSKWAHKDQKPDGYFVAIRDSHLCVVTWRFPYERLQQLGKKFTGAHWIATVKAHDRSEAGQSNAVELTLLSWVTDGDGKMKSRDEFEQFTGTVARAVS